MARVLFILFKDYSRTHDGGSQANMRNLNLARQVLGEGNVNCYYIHDVNRPRSSWAKVAAAFLFPLGYFNGLTPRKMKEIRTLSAHYDTVFIANSIFGLVAKCLKENGYKGRIISFFHNVESIYYESRVPRKLPFRKVIIGCAAKNEAYSLRYADLTVGLCRRDSDILKKRYGKSFDVLAPISFRDRSLGPSAGADGTVLTAQRPKCCFIGSNFPANANGILWFVKHVLPQVEIDFTVVGQDMDRLQPRLSALTSTLPSTSTFHVYNTVSDLTPYFEEADFMVFPVFDGSGMKVKTCEALMYGKNILGTTETFEGYDLDPNKCGRLCNTAEEYIEAIKEFSEHPVPRFNEYSRNIFVEKYSEKNSIRVFKEIFHSDNR